MNEDDTFWKLKKLTYNEMHDAWMKDSSKYSSDTLIEFFSSSGWDVQEYIDEWKARSGLYKVI